LKPLLDGKERQNYLVSNMLFKPVQKPSSCFRGMTLYPGEVICCGTSESVGSMKSGSDTIGSTLSNECKN
jgi:2-keto-4-pentenoate hydratase/2-oxohepta-3-ene-1,7-dioic acid hydratase in catechol pathway